MTRRIVLSIAVMMIAAFAVAPSNGLCTGSDGHVWTSFELSDYSKDLPELLRLGYDVVERHPEESTVEIIVSQKGFDQSCPWDSRAG